MKFSSLIRLVQMSSLGFDGYATDFITAPDALMWFLKKDVNLHRTVRR